MTTLQDVETQLTDATAKRAQALDALIADNPQVMALLAEWLSYNREVEALTKIKLELIASGKLLSP